VKAGTLAHSSVREANVTTTLTSGDAGATIQVAATWIEPVIRFRLRQSTVVRFFVTQKPQNNNRSLESSCLPRCNIKQPPTLQFELYFYRRADTEMPWALT